MKFEPLRYPHLRQMAQIESEAFDQPWTEAMFIPEVENEAAVYVVGTRGDEVLCYGGFHKVLDEAHITNIAVKKSERGRGLGKLLLAELIARARSMGVSFITLEVKDINERAIKLYSDFGFRVEGIRKRYYANKYDALIMWLDVREAYEQ